MSTAELTLEHRSQIDLTPTAGGGMIMMTPPISESYWEYRVRLSDTQSIVGFPKFGTIGIGFAVEEDWNTNLPSTCSTLEIFSHIRHNKGDDTILDINVMIAIRMIKDAATTDRQVDA